MKKLVILTLIVLVIYSVLFYLGEKGFDNWQIDSGLKDKVGESEETIVNLGMPVPSYDEVEEMIVEEAI